MNWRYKVNENLLSITCTTQINFTDHLVLDNPKEWYLDTIKVYKVVWSDRGKYEVNYKIVKEYKGLVIRPDKGEGSYLMIGKREVQRKERKFVKMDFDDFI